MTPPPAPSARLPRLGRRGFLAGVSGVVATGLAAGLTACGGGSSQAPAEGLAPSAGFPVSIPNRYGTAQIASAPRQIVTLGITDHDVLLPLGVVPAGLTAWGPWPAGVGPWVEPMLGGQRPKVFGSEVDVEGVIAQTPDLMIALQSALTQDQYNRLSSFNPVLAQPPGTIDYGVDWRVQAETIGKAVGRQADVQRLISETQSRIDRTRAENPLFAGRTHVTVRTDSAGTYAAYTKADARTRLLEQLGLRLSPAIEAMDSKGRFNVKVSKEQVSLLDADVVIVTTAKPTDVEAVRKDPLLNNLGAAKRGALVVLDDYDLTMALGSATVSSIPFALDRLTPKLVDALS
ncbi:iron complex transport system substrate-binding protein [Saccharopolyspora erythraea NRRL 2338]|uniref:Iron ABC transporter, substrate binding protein n=2 Tax=Saccharopolyspora erythraea TaxID=1836 RepID=A4FLC7_SACEN|nr:ABC transporter substrate-binding protein [Saccharopolyspora erythraea]EQD83792.1 iron ABC transporter substrate-binding protein [Saccharopolyspora erythraea D]PFG98493.1 iron complex transport system substrate-binding protein [Saccharopolyspora erythraea NRRL 2338]QRK88547.1 ABC transporter substrate-binding protein [Saccharopolyspora erythraea]CAM04852.1 iron ABC transporter, substrate binding protein [Saccharopolyspora erythraea NRRL 2338]